MLLILSLGILGALLNVDDAHAQKHSEFDARLIKNDKGQPTFWVRPVISNGRIQDTKEWGVYGVLMCFKRDGKQKAERKDMTYDLVNTGEYRHVLSYSTNFRITDFSYEFFDATQPSSTYPSKESCFD